jgi:hypothetical protein
MLDLKVAGWRPLSRTAALDANRLKRRSAFRHPDQIANAATRNRRCVRCMRGQAAVRVASKRISPWQMRIRRAEIVDGDNRKNN